VSAVLRAADAALLVAEPTPFGLSDLTGVLEVVADMKIPAGIVVNKTGMGDLSLDTLCRRFSVEVFARYPFSRSVAEAGARGVCPYRSEGTWVWKTESLWRAIERRFS
jgi:MinD superfamily P-loop ATPase